MPSLSLEAHPSSIHDGHLWEALFAAMDTCLINRGSKLTFVRGATECLIDVMVVTNDLLPKVMTWVIREDESLFYHQTSYSSWGLDQVTYQVRQTHQRHGLGRFRLRSFS